MAGSSCEAGNSLSRLNEAEKGRAWGMESVIASNMLHLVSRHMTTLPVIEALAALAFILLLSTAA